MKKGKEKIVTPIRNELDLSGAMLALSRIVPSVENPWTMTLKEEDETRSMKQNRLSFSWYQIRGSMTGHGKEYERELCKLIYGVPILCEDPDFNAFYLSAIAPMPFEAQRQAMAYVPVTRLMNVHQFAEYLNTIDQESANLGIVLPHPEDLYWDALMKEADSR